MKAADLIGDLVFDSLIKCWETDKRCPLALVDYLLENNLESQAEAARWAATEVDKKQFTFYPNRALTDHGPFPNDTGEDLNLFYWFLTALSTLRHANCVDIRKIKGGINTYRPLTDSLIWLLDNWIL